MPEGSPKWRHFFLEIVKYNKKLKWDFTYCQICSQDEFEKFGLVTDVYNTGKGYAFVTFDRKEDAETATMGMDGQTLAGQQIKVIIYYFFYISSTHPSCPNLDTEKIKKGLISRGVRLKS